jgi:hypothetical protein
MYKGFPVVLA